MFNRIHYRSQQMLFKGYPDDRHYLLQLLLLVVLISYPFLSAIPFFTQTLYSFLACVFVLYGLLLTKKPGLAMSLTGVCSIIIIFTKFVLKHSISLPAIEHFEKAELIIFLTYFTMLGLRLLQDTINVKVSTRLLYISMQNYLIIGLIFNYLFQLLHMYEPGAFNFPMDKPANYSYMSFIILTSVGLGDMLPLTNASKALVIAEAFAGQFYLTFFVALIIGKYLSEKSK